MLSGDLTLIHRYLKTRDGWNILSDVLKQRTECLIPALRRVV